jgi:hypothetical protein
MNSDEVEHLHELLKIHKKRVNVLEEQAAKYGINCPPEIKIEIEDIQEQIARFERQLQGNVIQSYLQGRETLREFNREMDSVTHGLSNVVVEEKRTYRFFGLPIWSVVISRTILTLLVITVVGGVGFAVQVQERMNTAAAQEAARATAQAATAAAQAAQAATAAAQATTAAARATAQATATEAAARATADAATQLAQDAADAATVAAFDAQTAMPTATPTATVTATPPTSTPTP